MGTRRRRGSVRPLSESKVREAEALLAKQLPKQAVAQALGISRQSVIRIATGKHVAQRQRNRYERCPCGALCVMPCGTCAANEYKAQQVA